VLHRVLLLFVVRIVRKPRAICCFPTSSSRCRSRCSQCRSGQKPRGQSISVCALYFALVQGLAPLLRSLSVVVKLGADWDVDLNEACVRLHTHHQGFVVRLLVVRSSSFSRGELQQVKLFLKFGRDEDIVFGGDFVVFESRSGWETLRREQLSVVASTGPTRHIACV